MAKRDKREIKLEEKIPQKQPTIDWVNTLYDINLINELELTNMYEAFKYVGFDRTEMLAELERKAGDPKIAVQLVILCALRGPLAAAKTQLLNNKTPEQMGIPGSGQIKTKNLSCARISAATADLAAFYLKRLKVSKRLISSECPAWLQFPSAGAIKLPDNLRSLHIEFSKQFSKLIGGEFREEIYSQMISNAYYDSKLHLFDDL
jgi:hypothetical protein